MWQKWTWDHALYYQPRDPNYDMPTSYRSNVAKEFWGFEKLQLGIQNLASGKDLSPDDAF